jgi:hypothetical protein
VSHPKKARIVVDAVDPNLVDQIYGVLRMEFGHNRVEEDTNGLIFCRPEFAHHAKRMRHDIMKVLEECNLASVIATPMRIEHWHDGRQAWVGDRADDAAAAEATARSRRRLTDVRWVVTIEPAGVFQWKNLRNELARRGRPILDERQGSIDAPASDEMDATQLAEELEKLECVRATSIRRLGWFERWRRREEVFGNYASDGPVGLGGF